MLVLFCILSFLYMDTGLFRDYYLGNSLKHSVNNCLVCFLRDYGKCTTLFDSTHIGSLKQTLVLGHLYQNTNVLGSTDDLKYLDFHNLKRYLLDIDQFLDRISPCN